MDGIKDMSELSSHISKYYHKKSDKKIEYYYQTIIFRIIPHNIPLCCQIFFHSWQNFRKDIPEYGKTMHILTDNQGIILCPDCMMERINVKTNRRNS